MIFCNSSPQRRRERKGKKRFDRYGYNKLSSKIIGAAIEVHKTLGPGLLVNGKQ